MSEAKREPITPTYPRRKGFPEKAHRAKALRLAQTSVIRRLERRSMCLEQRTKRSTVGDEVTVSEGPNPAVLYWSTEDCCLGIQTNKLSKYFRLGLLDADDTEMN